VFFVVIKGASGRYMLQLGTSYNWRRLNYFNLENVLKRPGPIEINKEKIFALPSDPAWNSVTVAGQDLHLSVLDGSSGSVVTESRDLSHGQHLDLSCLAGDQPHLLKVTRKDVGEERLPMQLTWQPARTLRTSENFLAGGLTLGQPIPVEGDWARSIGRSTVKATLSMNMPHSSSTMSGLRMVFLDVKQSMIGSTVSTLPQGLERAAGDTAEGARGKGNCARGNDSISDRAALGG
jgi:hypothetical protein